MTKRHDWWHSIYLFVGRQFCLPTTHWVSIKRFIYILKFLGWLKGMTDGILFIYLCDDSFACQQPIGFQSKDLFTFFFFGWLKGMIDKFYWFVCATTVLPANEWWVVDNHVPRIDESGYSYKSVMSREHFLILTSHVRRMDVWVHENNTLLHSDIYCHTLPHTATHGRTLQRTARHCNILQRSHAAHMDVWYRNRTHCNALQYIAK